MILRVRDTRLIRRAIATLSLLAGLVLVTPTLTTAQSGSTLDEDFAERVREWTTRPEFLSPLVDHLPVVDGIPIIAAQPIPNNTIGISSAYSFFMKGMLNNAIPVKTKLNT